MDVKLPILIISYNKRYLITKLSNGKIQLFYETSGISNNKLINLLKGLLLPCYGIIVLNDTINWIHKCNDTDIQWYQLIIDEAIKLIKLVENSQQVPLHDKVKTASVLLQEIEETKFFLHYFKSWEQLQITAQYYNIHLNIKNPLINIILTTIGLQYNIIFEQSIYKLLLIHDSCWIDKIELFSINQINTNNIKFLNKSLILDDERFNEHKIIDSILYQKDILNKLFKYYGWINDDIDLNKKYNKYKNKYLKLKNIILNNIYNIKYK